MFTGNIRINIDPENIFTDDEIIKALHFLKLIECLKNNLHSDMSDKHSFSAHDSLRHLTVSKLMSFSQFDNDAISPAFQER